VIVRTARTHRPRTHRHLHFVTLPLAAVLVAAAATAATASSVTPSPTAAVTGAPSALKAASVTAQYPVPGAILGSSGWQVLSSAKTGDTGTQISSTRIQHLRLASGRQRRRRRARHRDRGAAAERRLPERLLLDQHEDLLRLRELGRRRHRRAVRRALVVPHRLHREPASGQYASLVVNGIVGAGRRVGQRHRGRDAEHCRRRLHPLHLRRHRRPVKSGTNTLALEVYPNNPNTMLTLDDVDWNQIPPDNNTGIQFPVQLLTSDALSDADAHVVENNAADLSSSALTVKTNVTNHTSSSQTGVVAATITPPGSGADHGQPDGDRPGEHHTDGLVHPGRFPR
jgi:exo-1,4-beta-D-glucosaminidase